MASYDDDQDQEQQSPVGDYKSVSGLIDLLRQQHLQTAKVDPEQARQYRDLQDKAVDMYNRRADRDEWLQFADTIGKSLAKVGMGIAGQRAKTDVSGVDLGKSPDFLRDQDVANRDLNSQLGIARSGQEDLYRQANEENAANYKQWEASNRPLEEALRARTAEENQASAERRADIREGSRNKVESDRDRRAQLGQLDKEQQSLQKQLQAGRALYSDMSRLKGVDSPEDLDPNMKDRMDQEAALAGTTLDQALDAYKTSNEHATRKTGWFSSQTDVGARAGTFEKMLLGDTSKKLQDIQSKREQLEGQLGLAGGAQQQAMPVSAPVKSAPPAQAPAAPSSSQAPAPAAGQGQGPAQGQVKVISPDGRPGMIPASQVEAAKKLGYKLAK